MSLANGATVITKLGGPLMMVRDRQPQLDGSSHYLCFWFDDSMCYHCEWFPDELLAERSGSGVIGFAQ